MTAIYDGIISTAVGYMHLRAWSKVTYILVSSLTTYQSDLRPCLHLDTRLGSTLRKMHTTFAILALAATSALAQDNACTTAGGVCVDWRYYTCTAGVETGLCPGDSNQRCCRNCDAACESNIYFGGKANKLPIKSL